MSSDACKIVRQRKDAAVAPDGPGVVYYYKITVRACNAARRFSCKNKARFSFSARTGGKRNQS